MSKIPVVRQIAWQSVLFQFALLAVFVTAAFCLGGFTRQAAMIGALIYVLYHVLVKWFVELPMSRGLKLIQARKFEEAISEFENAYRFYIRYKWIDRARFGLLISSNVSFREMALINIAFCYSQIGQGTKSKEYYQRILVEFPESSFAKVALTAIKAFELNEK